MRLSRSRVLLRLVLLLVGAGFMSWKAWETEASSRAAGLDAGGALLLHRIALVELLLAVLALGTGVAAGLALRKRPARRRLGLVAPEPPAADVDAASAGRPAGPPGPGDGQ